MKKISVTLLFFFLTFLATAQEDKSFSIGVVYNKGKSLKISTIKKSYLNENPLVYMGEENLFLIGVNLEKNLSKFSLVGELLFSRGSYSFLAAQIDVLQVLYAEVEKSNLDYIEEKIKLRYYPIDFILKPYLEAGIVLGQLKNREQHVLFVDENKFIFGLNIGAGIKLKITKSLYGNVAATYEYLPFGILSGYDQNKNSVFYAFGLGINF